MTPLTQQQQQRFWAKVAAPNTAGCRLWIGCRNDAGYGFFRHERRVRVAHRLAWMLTRGEIPSGLLVCHSCDTPACCNPEHLFLGTNADNRRDCVAKGRTNCARGDANGARLHPETRARGVHHGSRTHPERLRRGEACTLAKLTDAAVRIIRASSDSQRSLAKRFGVSQATIWNVINSRGWSHVQD